MVGQTGILTFFEAISITFLGANAKDHDELTRQTGSFESALRSTKIIVDSGLPLTCFFVPIHSRCDSFDSLAEKLADLGVAKIRALALAPSGRARSIYPEAVPNNNEIARLEGVLQEARNHYGMCVEAGYCTRLLIRRLAVLSGHERCTSGLNRLHINFEGDVFPCTAASGVEELKIGNVKESELNLEVLWQESPKLNVIRSVHSGLLPECDECSQEPKCRDGCMVNTCGTMAKKLQIHCPLLISI
jgi:radical SAM protein with 4Fe4S-binding SPASM domain